MIGYLKTHYKEFENVDTITGASAGSAIGLFLAMGWHPDRIMDAILSLDTTAIAKTSIRSLIMNYGLIKTDKMRKAMEKLCGGDPTFSDLAKTLYVSAYSLNTGKTTYFSKYTHPDMPVIDAVLMSCTIPLLMTPTRYKDEIYLDGGCAEKWPSETIIGENPAECFVLRYVYPTEHELKSTSIISFIKNIVARIGWDGIKCVDPTCKCIILDGTGFNPTEFTMSYETKLRMIMKGTTFF